MAKMFIPGKQEGHDTIVEEVYTVPVHDLEIRQDGGNYGRAYNYTHVPPLHVHIPTDLEEK